jgi:hypothetical protein
MPLREWRAGIDLVYRFWQELRLSFMDLFVEWNLFTWQVKFIEIWNLQIC